MFAFLDKLRRPRPSKAPPLTYDVACACATRLTGVRTTTSQAVPCPRCGRAVFVLPHSPLPPPDAVAPDPPAAPARRRVGGLVLLLALVGLLIAAQTWSVLTKTARDQPAAGGPAAALPEHRERGQTALGDGNFHLAATEFEAALRLAGHLPAAERRRLAQQHGQAALLADLLREPLGELLQRAGRLPVPEWRRVFTRDYRGKALLVDASLRRQADGQYDVRPTLADGPSPVRWHLDDVMILHGLPLDTPRRLLVGARLADITREASGTWVIRFAPESGVLLTDEPAVAAGLFVPVDEALRDVLEWQAVWVAERP